MSFEELIAGIQNQNVNNTTTTTTTKQTPKQTNQNNNFQFSSINNLNKEIINKEENKHLTIEENKETTKTPIINRKRKLSLTSTNFDFPSNKIDIIQQQPLIVSFFQLK